MVLTLVWRGRVPSDRRSSRRSAARAPHATVATYRFTPVHR
ncbi:MAG: hypothetical protein AVDCRST_MAG49-3650 [uncultured Thermomicrobiales bacterium]|uniref:Uncharacterized protein n=1 Tax=uncultured Thermomicrobiales bacterium TaxID=1645740 RepID=A0A6J4V861_9BACT|nr:MAG: hypothetical protein AVDCRST_MAG49-3650 [uncultured Thermomicrobiales bacterium]